MSRVRLVLFSFVPAVLLFVILEGGLRVAGFRHEAAPIVLRFGYPEPSEITGLFRPDADLFWRLRPGSTFDAEAPVSINAAGYRGPGARDPRPPDVARVAVMGDSVAFGFGTAWPDLLHHWLAALFPERTVEVLNFGVPGYSVVQGVRQFDADVADLKPDVVLIAYGWNDHWLARGGLPDAERRLPSGFVTQVVEKLARLRTVQAVHRLIGAGDDPPSTTSPVRRVPEDVFWERVRELIEKARAGGAEPIVIGLPAGFDERSAPAYLVDSGFTPTARDAVRDHERYVELARGAAEATGATFVDLRPVFAIAGGSLFSGDLVHPSARGHALIATHLAEPTARAIAGREIP